MNPDSPSPVFGQFAERREQKTEPLAKIRKILPVAQPLHQPVRCEQQGCKAHEQAVDKIH